tara:strand:- start:973 stop:1281 length:309 start_codon:yes stop_codon:yes gene_type:complete
MATDASPNPGKVLFMAGTRKGAFMFSSNEARKDWSMKGPFMPSKYVFHMAYDSRDDGKTYVAANSMWFGPIVQFPNDFGQTWEHPKIQPVFRSHRDMSVNKV